MPFDAPGGHGLDAEGPVADVVEDLEGGPEDGLLGLGATGPAAGRGHAGVRWLCPWVDSFLAHDATGRRSAAGRERRSAWAKQMAVAITT